MSESRPTVVLVHGAFADASSWNGVIAELQADNIPVVAPPNPLRGLAADAAYVASAVNQIAGPVLLVGHSYGGAVITVAGAGVPNAVGLVYVAAFIPDEGEVVGAMGERFPTPLGPALRPAGFPVAGSSEPAVELAIAPELYPEVFAPDLPAADAAIGALTQRPIAASAFGEAAAAAAWKTLPSWAIVATGDLAIHPDAERFMAERAGAETIELDGSHSVAVSQPRAVADVIRTALEAVDRAAVATA